MSLTIPPEQRERINRMLAGCSSAFREFKRACDELGLSVAQAAQRMHAYLERVAMTTDWTDIPEIEFNNVRTDDLPKLMQRLLGLHPRLTASLVECYRCQSLGMLMASNLEVYLEDPDEDWECEDKMLDVNGPHYHFKLAVPEKDKPDCWWMWAEVREWGG